MDELGQDLRKGLQFGIAKLRRALMASKVTVTSRDDYGCTLLMSAAQVPSPQFEHSYFFKNAAVPRRAHIEGSYALCITQL